MFITVVRVRKKAVFIIAVGGDVIICSNSSIGGVEREAVFIVV